MRQTLRMQVYALSGDTGLISQNLDAPRVKLNSSHTSKKGQMNHSKEISLSSEKKMIFGGQLRWQTHHRHIQMTVVSAFHLQTPKTNW